MGCEDPVCLGTVRLPWADANCLIQTLADTVHLSRREAEPIIDRSYFRLRPEANLIRSIPQLSQYFELPTVLS